jgi:hypothetical protein
MYLPDIACLETAICFILRQPAPSSAEVTPMETVKSLDVSSLGVTMQPSGLSGSSLSGEASTLIPVVSSWCADACKFLSDLPEKLQMGLKGNNILICTRSLLVCNIR